MGLLALAIVVYACSRSEERIEAKRDLRLIGRTFLVAIPASDTAADHPRGGAGRHRDGEGVAVIGIAYYLVVGAARR